MGKPPIGTRKQGVGSENGCPNLAKFAMRRAAHNAHIAKEEEPISATRIETLELNLLDVTHKYLSYIDQLHFRLLEQEKMIDSQKEVNAYLMTMVSKADDRINEHTQQLKAMTSIHHTYCQLFKTLGAEKPPFRNAENLLRFYEKQPIDSFGDLPYFLDDKEKQVFCPPSPFPPNAHPKMFSNSEQDDFVKTLWREDT